jgi:hypothetical protein
MITNWYVCDQDGQCRGVVSGVGVDFVVVPDYEGVYIYAEGCCPDPGSASGLAQCVETLETPIVLPPTLPPIVCPGASDAGGQGTFSRLVDVGEGFGTFNFFYQAFTIPDRFIISGAAQFDTGVVSGSANVTITKTSDSRWITVRVEGPLAGTAWNYSVGCTVVS